MAFPLSDTEHATIKAQISAQPELIVAAAVRLTEGRVLMVERPGRHGDCINWLHRLGADRSDHGFITNRGRFVDHVEAAHLVQETGQGSPRSDLHGLFSEDMWNDWDTQPTDLIDPAKVKGYLEATRDRASAL